MHAHKTPGERGPGLLVLVGLIVLVAGLFTALQMISRPEAGAGAGEDGVTQAARDPVEPRAGARRVIASRPEATPTRASGRVVDEGGRGLAGAVVLLTALDGGDEEDAQAPIHARAGADGGWAVEEIVAGRYALNAAAPEHLPGAGRVVTLAPRADNDDLDVVLQRGGSAMRGVVRDMTGGTVEGALVRLTPAEGVLRLRARDSFATLSAEDGSYALQVADGRYRVSALHVDYAAEHGAIELRGAARERDFSLTPMAVIEGRVVERPGGPPVPGARVRYARERQRTLPDGQARVHHEPLGQTRADDQGRFRVGGLSPGTVLLSASAPGKVSASPVEVPLAIAEQREGVEVVVGAARSLRGRVVVKGAPAQGVAGARVYASSPAAFDPATTTDERGAFELHGLLPGVATVHASARGYITSLEGTAVRISGDDAGDDAFERAEVVLELDPGLMIRGRGVPAAVADRTLELDPAAFHFARGVKGVPSALSAGRVTTAEDGVFAFGPVEPGRLTLVAEAADGRGGSVEVEVEDEDVDDVIIDLEPRARASGVVVDARGAPVAGALVSLSPAAGAAGRATLVINGKDMSEKSSPTADDGRFSIVGLQAGEYEARVSDALGEPLAFSPPEPGPPRVAVAAGEAREGVELRVEACDGEIRGRVRTAEGAPAPDTWVTATLVPDRAERTERAGEPGASRSSTVMMISLGTRDGGAEARALPPALTDDDGRFAFTGLKDGAYTLRAEGDGHARVDDVRPGADVDLELSPLGAIEGRVTLDGAPLGGAAFAMIKGPSQRSARVHDGAFTATRLEPGAYTVSVETERGSASRSVQVRGGDAVAVAVALTPWAMVRGRVVDGDGAPIVGATLLLGEGDAHSVSVTREGDAEDVLTDDEGRFELPAGSGPRVLMVMSPDAPTPLAIRPFVVRDGQNVELGDIAADPALGSAAPAPDEPR